MVSLTRFIQDKRLMTRALADTITNLAHLKKDSMYPCSVSETVFNVMNGNHVQLDHFGYVTDTDANGVMIKEELATIQSAQPVSSIFSLKIKNRPEIDDLLVGPNILNLCRHLRYLTCLTISWLDGKNTIIVLIDILQNLTTLKSLESNRVAVMEMKMTVVYFKARFPTFI